MNLVRFLVAPVIQYCSISFLFMVSKNYLKLSPCFDFDFVEVRFTAVFFLDFFFEIVVFVADLLFDFFEDLARAALGLSMAVGFCDTLRSELFGIDFFSIVVISSVRLYYNVLFLIKIQVSSLRLYSPSLKCLVD